jgi:predicted membrane-bound mannosyltransferase
MGDVRSLAVRMRDVEHLPFAVCFVVGALLRLGELGVAPLSSAEAAAAWAAWSSATAEPGAVSFLIQSPNSAALFGLQYALFWLTAGGGGDVAARIFPAFAGCAMILLPWLARRSLGRAVSLSLAALLAIDPWLAGYSRLGDGAILAAASAWTVVVGRIVLTSAADGGSSRRRGWVVAVTMAAGLLLVSGPVAWDFLPPVALAWALIETGPAASRRANVHVARDGRWTLMLVGAIGFATSGFVQWQGPRLWSAGLQQWLSEWSGGASPAMLDLLLRYQLLAFILGAAGLISWLISIGRAAPSRLPSSIVFNRRLFVVLTLWLVWGCLVMLRPGRPPSVWLVVQLPMLLGGARGLGVVVGAASRRSMPVRAAGAVAGVLLLYALHGSTGIASQRVGSRFQPYPDVTDPAVRLLVDDVDRFQAGISRARPPDAIEIVSAGGRDPVLTWYLRGRPNVHWPVAPSLPSSEPGRPVVIAPFAGPVDEDAADRTARSDRMYRLRRSGSTPEWLSLR